MWCYVNVARAMPAVSRRHRLGSQLAFRGRWPSLTPVSLLSSYDTLGPRSGCLGQAFDLVLKQFVEV